MVQQNSSGGGAGGGSRTDLSEAERAELERRERIQRYKDERRKQIAARYGTAEWSSSEESAGGEESSFLAYRRRRRKGRDADTSSTDLSPHDAKRPQENGSSLEGRGRRLVGGSSSEDVVMGVRTNRTSRLRHAALSSSSNNNNNNKNNNSSSAHDAVRDATPTTENVGDRGRAGEPSPDRASLKRLPDQAEGRTGIGGDSADSTLSGSDGRGGRRRVGGEERDKSHKRKSNLNRSTTSEEPAADLFPPTHPSDSNEETPRRRRRRGPASPVSGGLSVAGAEPLKTPDVVRHVVSRLTPPTSPPTHPPAQPSPPPTRRHPSPQPTAPAHTFQPIQPALPHDTTHSAPSTLDSRSRFAQEGESRSTETRRVNSSLGERSETEEGTVRKVPPKLAPLRKPEIPDVLRPKDTTGLASPGVVNTPPNSRPSSVVLEKPPLAPEGLRPANIRSSLRKPNDTGTCFMAARREKRDETKPENIFRELQQRPRKGDRLSKSDMNLKIESSYSGKQSDPLTPGGSDLEASGASSSPTASTPGATINSEEVMSSRLEALTARARETMERVDRLADDSPPPPPESSPPEDSADSVVHECEEYLTVNANRKDSSGSVRPRDISIADTRSDRLQAPTAMKGVISDTGQKNWVGGSEGRGKESKRLAMEKEMNRDVKRDVSQVAVQEKVTAASAVPSGPPDHGAFNNDSANPPPEEVVHGLQHEGYEDEDLCSPDSSQIRSPEHHSNKRGSRRCSLDEDSPRTNSPDPQSILKHRSSREDVTIDRPTTPEPHSILKRKTSSRTSSIDTVEGEPRPILKKKSSIEELDHFEPRPILKKKSSTDDELDDRPRSILKGGRSREDLDRAEGVISPNPILKRSPRCDSEGEGELRPILKRRDTTDGVRLRLHVSDGEDVDGEVPSVRVRSDSAPEAVIRIRGRSPPAPSATPSHGILKKRGAHSPGRFDQMDSELGAILRSRRSLGPDEKDMENDASNRPVSPSLGALIKKEESSVRSSERPLSVAERVAGMEAARQEPLPPQRSPTPTRSPGARPKVMPSFLDRSPTPTDKERDTRRNSAFGLVADSSPADSVEAINEAFLDRPVVEAFNCAMSPGCDITPDTPSSVSQKAAFFAQLEREQKSVPDSAPAVPSRSARFTSRRDRGTRHATQPVTDDEVSQAARLADASDSASASHDSDSAPPRRGSLPWKSGTQGETSSSQNSTDKSSSSKSVGARVALWTKRLDDERRAVPPLDGAQGIRRRSRSARFKTQPVTLEEVAHAHALNSQAVSTPTGTPEEQELASGFRAARDAVLRNAAEVMQGLTPGSSPRRRPGSRKTSLNEPDEEYSSDPVRGILKRDGCGGSREAQRDSPRSILKHSSCDSRRASFSESEHPRGILKSDSPLPPSIGSPEHDAKLLRGVLKKDSSLEDSKEIKSILKPESECLEPDHSSDSSSANTPQGPECDIAESIRDIDPIRHKDDTHKSDTPHKVDPFKTEHHRADLADALRQVEPIKSKDDLAEALRQIEPIHSKERSREKEDKGKDETQITSVREISSFTKATSSMATMVVTAANVSSPSSAATTNSSSSTSESEHKVIKNEAVMRRRTAHSRRYDERRSMVELRSLEQQVGDGAVDVSVFHHDTSESSSSSSSDSAEGLLRTSRTAHQRSSYISSTEMDASQILQQSPLFKGKSSSSSSSSPEQTRVERTETRSSSPATSTINARLAALQKSGEDGWKNRVKKESKDVNSNVTLRPKPAGNIRERPVSLMERMSALETSSQQWRGRITHSDATKFTVAHKMASSSTSSVPSVVSGTSPLITVTPEQLSTPTGSPLIERKKRSPCQKVFKSKTGGNLPSLLNKSSPLTPRKDFRRSISTPNDGEKKGETPEGTSVSVPRADDESFNAFFSRTSYDPSQLPEIELPTLEDADFDHISETVSQLRQLEDDDFVVKRRSVRVTRRQVASRNPLKALAAREDLKSEYTEVKMGVGERELRRMKVEELSKGSPMAVEALAGLASRENFSAVALKKVESTPVVREMAPYTSLMLLQVKGRRHAQTRLVEPKVTSVNQGDDFILITPTDVYHYKGEFANVIERAKAAEIAQYILQKKDMGITSSKNLIELDENSPSGRKSKFWKLLGGDETSEAVLGGTPDEDEYVEAALVAANKIYEVQDDSLVPIPDSWGQMPKIELLSSDKVLVFDFGPELYIWAGKRACGDERKVGVVLGRELWEEHYDYSECDINPITPMTPISKAKMKGTRPEWGLCAKLTENVETILFKEKFIDWPDLAQQSRIKEVKKELDRHVAPVCELQPCDAKMMLEDLPLEPDLVLEMSHLGRGVEYYDEEERRLLSISTNDFKVWHVSEYGKVLMDVTLQRHLYAGDTYVVRWYYLVTATGRTLKGEPSKHNVTGRTRVAYFFWQGRESSVSDKGVSALMTVELDEERGPHVRVSMGLEPPAFLNLFQGGLVVHQGRQEDDHTHKHWKLFIVRGENENEGHLVEIEVSSTHLRSRGCLILADIQAGVIHLWHGAKSLKHTRKVANVTAQKLSETTNVEMGWEEDTTIKIKEQFEGAESRDFWEGFGGSSSKNKHFSLLEDDHSYDFTPRIWHLEPTHDSFQATEVICSYRATSLPNPLPVLQLDLYSVPQPALFMVDGGHQVWVWQGWWPDETSEGEDFSATGSAVLRFNFARRAGLQTALNYCKTKAKSQAKALAARSYKKIEVKVEVVEPQLVVAGLEPLEFTNTFPTWTPRPDVTAIQEKEGRWKQDGQYMVSDILAQLSRTSYSLAELTIKPLPDGVDPLHLEVYLSEEEFTEALGMNREEFYCLQNWKQTEIKKKAKLF
ncbi:serine/arginine repetitive matrix protein 2-like isoform X3 [Homarus americanus]|uniref:serine/arginine repetitive matrix protein 2-like isoform X3 n=1 Tax=Homarus americanus TaxID=6706 RepID=UPI001C479F89|nr:serine/arginine repetitive matrix protein 2-like isoform X3 [Homarus americanus]